MVHFSVYACRRTHVIENILRSVKTGKAGKRYTRYKSVATTQHDPVWITVYFVMLSLDFLCHSFCFSFSKQIVNVLWKNTNHICSVLPTSLSPLVSDALSEANSGVVAEIRVTKTTTEEGVTVMGTGTLPCSVLVHYSIISQWSPHKSELCAARGEVPYGTSDPERQRVAKDP